MESVVRRMRRKAIYEKAGPIYGLQTNKVPDKRLLPSPRHNTFQWQLASDAKAISTSRNVLVSADPLTSTA